MSGCYGNDPEDKHFETRLHEWEDSQTDEVDDESRDMRREREESDTL